MARVLDTNVSPPVYQSSGLFETAKSRLKILLYSYTLQAATAEENNVKAQKVLVGGGTGFVGNHVVSALRQKGYNVIVVSRRPGQGMTYDDLANQGIPANTRAVVNVAGQNVLDPLNRWTEQFKQKVYNSRIGTATAFRDAIVSSDEKPNVYVQITGVGYYPPSQSTVYDENWKRGDGDANNYFTQLVTDWEAAAAVPKELGVRNVYVRSGVVLGRTGGVIGRIFLPFYFGAGGRMGSGTQPMAWIHVKDLAGVIAYSVEQDNVEGVLNGVAPHQVNNQEFVDAFAAALHRPAFIPLPDTIWNLAFGHERATMITKGQKVLPTKTLATGYTFRYPTISEACQEFAHFFYTDPHGQ